MRMRIAGAPGSLKMTIQEASKSYERWLGKRLNLLPLDLKRKHLAMAAAPFPYFRATFYRWMQLWNERSEPWTKVPSILAVGDLHVENFGTWRDVEGRLVWGVNDFDEAYPLPFTIDLIRLSASAHIAIAAQHLTIGSRDACEAILTGYNKAISTGGTPIVLAEHHEWLRRMVTGELRDPVLFWEKMDALPMLRRSVPKPARRALERWLPEKNMEYRVAHRVAGLGSLGRERYVALGQYRGGKVAREAKALAPSACVWAGQQKPGKGSRKASEAIRYGEILSGAQRCRDPFVHQERHWVVRRLAPDCSRVELASLPKARDEVKLLNLMGFETANIHLSGKRATREIAASLKSLPQNWLHDAAEIMIGATLKDYKSFKKG